MYDVQNSNYYSLSFDKSLNRVTQKLRNGAHDIVRKTFLYKKQIILAV